MKVFMAAVKLQRFDTLCLPSLSRLLNPDPIFLERKPLITVLKCLLQIIDFEFLNFTTANAFYTNRVFR